MENPLFATSRARVAVFSLALLATVAASGFETTRWGGAISFYQVWRHFPKDWEYMCGIEAKLFQLEIQGKKVQNKYWFSGQRTCVDMENILGKSTNKAGFLILATNR